MDTSTVFKKTAKGLEEAKHRTNKINMRVRAALLMVNGKDSVETMIKRFYVLTDIAGFLDELRAHGYITEVKKSAGVEQALRHVVSRVRELLGPEGDAVAERLEQIGKTAKTLAPLMRYLDERRDMFDGILGKHKAADFFEEMRKFYERQRHAED